MKTLFFSALFAAGLCFSGASVAAVHGAHNVQSHTQTAGQAAGQTAGRPDGQATPAQRHRAPQLREMAGQEVDTEYFKLVIPAGWSMPVPVKHTPGQGMTVIFASMSKSPAVSLTVMKTPGKAKQIGEMTLENMKKGGITSTPLEEKDGMWHASLSGKGKGVVWFGDNDGTAAVTVITGDNVEKADEILSALDAKVKGLFPKSAQ